MNLLEFQSKIQQLSPRYSITNFRHRDDAKNGIVHDFTWPDLATWLKEPRTASRKEDVPGWSPCAFVDNHRLKAGARAVCALVLDVDNSGDNILAMERVAEHLIARGFAFLLYESWSSSPEHPKFRVVLPLAEPVDIDPDDHKARWVPSALATLEWPDEWRASLDCACFDKARFWHHAASHDGIDPRFIEGEGESLIVPPLPPLPEKNETPKPARVTAAVTGAGDYSTLNVTAWFAAQGLYVKSLGSGKHAVECPWATEHTTKSKNDTVVWEAAGGKWPTFHCSHAHCEGRGIQECITLFGDADEYCSEEYVKPDLPLIVVAPHEEPVECEILPPLPRGVIRDLADYMLRTAPTPLPSAAQTGALAYCANAMGRIVCGPSGLRTNVYVCQLAGTGSGKDWPRKIIKNIIREVAIILDPPKDDDDKKKPENKYRVIHEIGEGAFSDSALMTGLCRSPRRLFLLDEFGRTLQCAAAEGNSGLTTRSLDFLTRAATSADSVLIGSEYADEAREPRTVEHPCLTVYASAAQETVYPALHSSVITSGFLPRFLVVIDPTSDETREVGTEHTPADIVEWTLHVRRFQSRDNLMGIPSRPFKIRRNAEAADMFRCFAKECNERRRVGGVAGNLWTRALEHADKLVTIAAVASTQEPDLDSAKAGGEHVEWSIAFVRSCIDRLVAEIDHHVSDTSYGADRQKVLAAFREAGKFGLTEREVTGHRVIRQIAPRVRKSLLDDLRAAGEIVKGRISRSSTGRPSEVFVLSSLVSAEFLQES